VSEEIETAGFGLINMPSYSPDLASTQPAWSKMKALPRAVAARVKNVIIVANTTPLHVVTAAYA